MGRKKIINWLFLLSTIVLIASCGPSTFTKVRYEFQPFDEKEFIQTKENITIERDRSNKYKTEFIASAPECDPQTGLVVVDSNRNPKMKVVGILPEETMIERISITNNTDHIIRLNSAIIVAFDPADNEYKMLSKEEMLSLLQQQQPCPMTYQHLAAKYSTITFLDRNVELLPNRTKTGYLCYRPHDPYLKGVWKLSFYEIPVEVDSAGKVIKTVNFDFRHVVKKFEDTYRRDNAFSPPEKISTKEIE